MSIDGNPSPWQPSKSFAGPEPGTVHVWRFPLTASPDAIERFSTSLSTDERERSTRFRLGDLRRRFIVGRGTLRAILARYRSCSPRELDFIYRENGKPMLADHEEHGLHFNLAHSHELALCAVAQGGSLGVDLEHLHPMENASSIVRRFFSPAEQDAYSGLPEPEKFAAFYRGWTRKEAFLKATGTGLATQLDSFDVSLVPDAPPALLRIGSDPSEPGRWTIHDVDPGPGYAGALVVAKAVAVVPVLRLWETDFSD